MVELNNPDDVIQEEEVTNPGEENTQPEVTETPEQDTTPGTEQIVPPKEESTQFDWADKGDLEKYAQEHPEFAPHVEKLLGYYKGMQGSYTKAMQNVPKHLRNANLTDLENKAKQWDNYNRTKGNQPLVIPPPAKEFPQVKEELLQRAIKNLEANNYGEPLSQEQKNVLQTTLEMLEGIIDVKTKPIVDQVGTIEEERIKNNLANNESLQYFDINSFWPDVQALRKANPNLSYDNCLYLAIQQTKEFVDTESGKTYTSPGEYFREMEAKDTPSPKVGKGGFVVGGNKGGGKKTPTYSQAEIDKMTPEEYEEKVLTPQQRIQE